MLRTILIALVTTLIFTAPATAKTFGDGVTLTTETKISAILDNVDNYLGQPVQIKGTVVDVCARRGCWVYIAGDRPFEKLRVKVTDGEIVFPMEARGKQAIVEGIVEKFELTREQVIKRRQHHAEERGETFDPASVTGGETVIRLRGLGAEIPGL